MISIYQSIYEYIKSSLLNSHILVFFKIFFTIYFCQAKLSVCIYCYMHPHGYIHEVLYGYYRPFREIQPPPPHSKPGTILNIDGYFAHRKYCLVVW